MLCRSSSAVIALSALACQIVGVTAFVAPSLVGKTRLSTKLYIQQIQPVKDISYGEESRKYRRTVYTHDDWRRHRSPDRFGRNLSSIFFSGVYKSLGKEILATTLIASFVVIWNALVGGYTDLEGEKHAAVIASGSLPMVGLPLNPFTLSSPSLGLLLVFRTNTAYQRWDEARKNWGMNINHTRDLVRMGTAFYDRTGLSPEKRKEDLKVLSDCTWAFVRSMKRHLSPEDEDEEDFKRELFSRLPESQAQAVIDAAHRPNRALSDLSVAIERLPMHFLRKNEVHKALTIFEDNLGSSERLLTSPVPLFYSRHTARFLSVWMLLLPLALYDSFGTSWNHIAEIPAVAVISMFLFGIEELATQLEEPFTILPMQAFCDKIGNWCKEIVSWEAGDNGMVVKTPSAAHSSTLPPSLELSSTQTTEELELAADVAATNASKIESENDIAGTAAKAPGLDSAIGEDAESLEATEESEPSDAIASVSATQTELEDSIAGMRTKKSELVSEIANMEAEKLEMTELIADMNAAKTELANMVAGLADQKVELAEAVADIEVAKSEKTQVMDVIADMTTKKSELDGAIANMEAEKSELADEIAGMNAKKTELAYTVAGMADQQKELAAAIANIETEKTEKTELTDVIVGMTTKKSELAVEINDLEMKKSELMNVITDMSARKTELVDAVTDLTTQKLELASEIAEMEAAKLELMDVIADLNARKTQLADAVDEMTTSKLELASEIADMEAVKSELADSIASLKTELADSKKTLADSEKELADVPQQVPTQNTITNQPDELTDSKKELADVPQQSSALNAIANPPDVTSPASNSIADSPDVNDQAAPKRPRNVAANNQQRQIDPDSPGRRIIREQKAAPSSNSKRKVEEHEMFF